MPAAKLKVEHPAKTYCLESLMVRGCVLISVAGWWTPATPDMTDTALPQADPIRCIATDAATDAVPLALDGQPDFEAWSAVVADLADDIARDVRAAAEVDA